MRYLGGCQAGTHFRFSRPTPVTNKVRSVYLSTAFVYSCSLQLLRGEYADLAALNAQAYAIENVLVVGGIHASEAGSLGTPHARLDSTRRS